MSRRKQAMRLLVVFVGALVIWGLMGARRQQERYGYDYNVVFLQTRDGQYVTSCVCPDAERCDRVLCLRDEPYLASRFVLHRHRDNRYSIENDITFKHWNRCAQCIPKCYQGVCADGENAKLPSSKFEIIENANGTVSFRADNGRLMQPCNCQLDCAEDTLCANALAASPETEFIMTQTKSARARYGDPVTPRTAPNKLFASASAGQPWSVIA